LVPFEYTIAPVDLRDQSEMFKEFEVEFPGILNWAIEGYRNFKDEGVAEPKSVLDATKEYRNDSDTLGRFMEECCIKSSSSVATKELFNAYSYWCNSNSEIKQFNQPNGLTRELKKRGFKVRPGHGRKTFLDGYEIV